MFAVEVDEYPRAVEEPKRGTLEALRRTILEIAPEAEQVISYRVPAFRVEGKTIAGFAAFKDHVSYLPFSGSVLPRLAGQLAGYFDDQEFAALPRRPAAPEDAREGTHRRAPRRTQASVQRLAD